LQPTTQTAQVASHAAREFSAYLVDLARSRRQTPGDDLISGLAGTELSGKQVEISGFPGFEYEFDLEDPPEGRSRLFMLFDGKTEYTLNCQSTPDKRDELQAACRQAVDTLAKTGD